MVETLVLSLFGRPRRTGVPASFSSQGDWERSGASSSSEKIEPVGIDFLFSLIGFPHADDPLIVAPWRPDENHHSLLQKPDRDVTALAVVETIVLYRQMRAVENFAAAAKVQAAFRERGLMFCLIKNDCHLSLLQK
ncbi:hypothetical protein [Aliirhizobium terrae]|uniref:hypothetical protein n=1 Tax=Terrirhizobium terrae TaxID=2926709 RepID=UPI0040419F2A